MLPLAVAEHYRRQQRLIVATLGLVRREWAAVDFTDIDGSWAKVAPRVNLLTASAQVGSASNGAAYVAATLGEYGDDVPVLGDVDPRAFAGVASDGRPLGSLLDGAAYRAKAAQSLAAGGSWLDMAVHTQIADAGRGAAATAIAARLGVGWVRMVNPPCCGPCAVLSGREYRYNDGFQRHPRCDCVHVPTTLDNPGEGLTVDPSLDQITDLTDAERKALEEGADLSRVINARRGGYRGKMSTTELAKRGRARLTPDGIFAKAGSREEALSLLREHGYLTNTARRVSTAAVEAPSAAEAVEAALTPSARAQRLADFLGDRGDVSGFTDEMSEAAVESIIDTYTALMERFPEVTGGLRVTKVTSGFGGKRGAVARANAILIDGEYQLGGIDVSPRILSKGYKSTTHDIAVEHGWHPPMKNEFAGTITHEFGHVLDFWTQCKLSPRRIANRLMKEAGVSKSDADLWLRKQRSGYAATERAEWIAEAFMDVETNGANATDVSKAIHEELMRLVEARRARS